MILERLKQYIDRKSITIAAFERSVGMSNSSFGKSLKNNGAIGTDKLENILIVYPDISPIWLLTGVGDMLIGEYQSDQANKEIITLKAQNDLLREQLAGAQNEIREQAKELGKCEEHLQLIKQLRADLEQAQATVRELTSAKNVVSHHLAPSTAPAAP